MATAIILAVLANQSQWPYLATFAARLEPHAQVIDDCAEINEIEVVDILATIYRESSGQADAESWSGAVGLMGIMPLPGRPSVEDLKNPATNLHLGCRILADLVEKTGSVDLALFFYSGGMYWDPDRRGVFPKAWLRFEHNYYEAWYQDRQRMRSLVFQDWLKKNEKSIEAYLEGIQGNKVEHLLARSGRRGKRNE